MKKLKVKVFSVIFSLLTIFTLVIFITSTTRTYIEKRDSVTNILNNASRTMGIMNRDIESKNGFPPDKIEPNEDIRRIYLDFTIYTIILDESGNYKAVINNTNNEEINEEEVKNIATNIINNHKDKYYIGNLYRDRYSYTFTNNNTLVVMDNTNINHTLTKHLITNSIIFILSELLVFIITYFITKWIITPVKNSFEKQKVFVADASHELKTPLAVIVASVDAYNNDKDEKWIKNIKNESERMNKLITDLLDLAKTEKEQDLVMDSNNIPDIVEGSILTFESLFYENKIKLKYDIEPDIKLSCNEYSIVELISILIDNAIKHCSNKGKVNVNLYKKSKQIVLEVSNTGLPIKKEDEEKIFERFYKVDTSRNRNSNNYGLGLAIAKNIVEQHKGTIKAYSENGVTTFKVVWNQK